MRPYRARPGDRAHHARITAMFDRISPRYDLLNAVMTFGLVFRWRRALVRSLDPRTEPCVLDACTGTGDVALALARRGHRLVGLDAAHGMLVRAREKAGDLSIHWIEGDCRALPVPDDAFDAVTISFGIRNIADRVAVLREFARAVRPGGRLAVLEVLPPDSPFRRRLLRAYERWIVPVLGRLLARDRAAYEYLGSSIAGFGSAAEFAEEIASAGWRSDGYRWLAGGSVALFLASRP